MLERLAMHSDLILLQCYHAMVHLLPGQLELAKNMVLINPWWYAESQAQTKDILLNFGQFNARKVDDIFML